MKSHSRFRAPMTLDAKLRLFIPIWVLEILLIRIIPILFAPWPPCGTVCS